MIGLLATALHNIGDSILADAELAAHHAIAPALRDQFHDLGRESVGFRPLTRLPTEPLAACPSGEPA